MNKPLTNSRDSHRLMSIDALRGFDMFWIIGGGALVKGLAKAAGDPLIPLAAQFEHVPWEGLHFEDLIWPLFMFIVGISIPLSIEKRRNAGASRGILYIHALRRVLILFLLGAILQGDLLKWDLDKLRPFYSVLHGIAAGYLIAFVLVMEFRPKMQLILTVLLLLLYWAIAGLIPIPGMGAAIYTPKVNLAIYVDQIIQGRFHYGENTWFLSYPGFASSVMMGVMAAHILRMKDSEKKKLSILISAGIVCVLIGLAWSPFFPIIKLMWTSSFVLMGGGFGFLMLALFYWIIEVKGYRRWAFFFTVIGMNSIAVYTLTMLISFRQIGNIFIGSLLPRIKPWDEFVSALGAITIVWLILYWMYRKKSFVKI